jgi:hypothetical protein
MIEDTLQYSVPADFIDFTMKIRNCPNLIYFQGRAPEKVFRGEARIDPLSGVGLRLPAGIKIVKG